MYVKMKRSRAVARDIRKTIFLCVLASIIQIIFCLKVHAQDWALEFGTGGFNYQGELRSERFTSKGMRTGFSVGLRQGSDRRIAVSARFSSGMLTGRDADNSVYMTRRRNLHFESRIHELSLTGQYFLNDKEDGVFNPFFSAGLALFYVNPYTYDRHGVRHHLYDLSLEGQGLSDYPQVKSPGRLNLSFPISAGFALPLTEILSLEVEMMTRKTFSDQIDAVSGFYPKEEILRKARGSLAVDLSYRADELTGENPDFPAGGTMRGNPETKDWYYGIMLKFVWSIMESNHSYPPRQKFFKPRGWPYRL